MTVVVGDHILVKDQTNPIQNGTWVATSPPTTAMTRRADTFEPESTVRVSEGDRNAHTCHKLVTQGTITVGVTSLRFSPQDLAFNVRDYGAIGDGNFFRDAAILAGSLSTLSSATANFAGTAEDDGKSVVVLGAGPNGTDLVTTITHIAANTTQVTLATAASSAVPNASGEGTAIVWGHDDTAAIDDAATAAAAAGKSGRLFFPTGVYAVANGVAGLTIPANVQVELEEGAMIAPAVGSVTINGRVRCHPEQYVFGGIGANSSVTQPGGLPVVAVSGEAYFACSVVVQIEPADATKFRISVDGGTSYWPLPARAPLAIPAPGTPYEIPLLGVLLHFPAGPYTPSSLYSFDTHPGIMLSPQSFARINVANFGALADWDDALAAGTDNRVAFAKAIGAVTQGPTPMPISVDADGAFYHGNTFHIARPVVLEGTGGSLNGYAIGTRLVFATNCTGIRIHGTTDPDAPSLGGAAFSHVHRLSVWCEETRGAPNWPSPRQNVGPYGHTGHGIHSTTVCTVRDVQVQNFAENGIYIYGQSNGAQPELGSNAAGSLISNCYSAGHGAHGFAFEGDNANVSTIQMCAADINYGNGFNDQAGTGNTYVGCYGQGNAGAPAMPNYGTDGFNHDFYVASGNINSSTFFGCYSEESVDQLYSPASAFGGTLSGASFPLDDDAGFGLLGGVMSGGALKYRSRSSLPNSTSLDVGAPPTRPDELLRFGRSVSGSARSPTFLTYESKTNRWSLYTEVSTPGPVMEIPTRESKITDRYPAPSFPNGIFIGRAQAGGADPIGIDRCHWRIAPLFPPPATDSVGDPATYKTGDVIWQSNPAPASALGQVCLTNGTQGKLRDFSTTGTISTGSATLTLTPSVPGFAVGKYVTIGDLGVFEITAYADPIATVSPVAPAPGAAGGASVNVVMVATGIVDGAKGIITVDDSTGLSPGRFITIDGVDYQVEGLGTAAYLDCSNPDDSSPTSYNFSTPLTLEVWIDLRGVQTITIPALGVGTTAAAVVTVLNAAFHDYGADSAVAETTGAGSHYVRIRSNTTGENSRVQVTGGSANVQLGFTTDNVTRVYGTADGPFPPVAGEELTLDVNGGVTPPVTITFIGNENTQDNVIAFINAAVGFECAVATTSSSIMIQGRASGYPVVITAGAVLDALPRLGLVAGTTQYYVPATVDTTTVTLTPTPVAFANPPPELAVQYTPATFGSFGRVESGTKDFDVTVTTVLDDTTANSETIRLAGAPGGPVTLTFATLRDGWSGRFLNLTGQDVTLSGAGGGSSVLIPALVGGNPPTQRLYIEDTGGGTLNVRAEAPPIAA